MSKLWRNKMVSVAVVLAVAGVSSVASAQEEEAPEAVEAGDDAAEVDEAAEVEEVEEAADEVEEAADEVEEAEEVEETAEEVEETAEEVEEETAAVEEAADVEEAEEVEEAADVEEAEEVEETGEVEEAAVDEVAQTEEPADVPTGGAGDQTEEVLDETSDDPVEEVRDVDEEAEGEEREEILADEEEADEEEESFSPTLAAGLETGYFFTDLERFNDNLLTPNGADTFSVGSIQHVDLIVESEVVENLRLSILGGTTFSWQSDPSLVGWYVGVEPAFVAGDETWEMALGSTIGFGGLRINEESNDEIAVDREVAMSLTLLRPFVEVRRTVGDMTGLYMRAGFNQWFPRTPRSDEFDTSHPTVDRELGAADLGLGGLYVSAGFRFGALQGLDQFFGDE